MLCDLLQIAIVISNEDTYTHARALSYTHKWNCCANPVKVRYVNCKRTYITHNTRV